jgi:LPXTG-site transpeptidase (sortase) family protein
MIRVPRSRAASTLLTAVLIGACGTGGERTGTPEAQPTTTGAPALDAGASGAPATDRARSPLADQLVDLGSAVYDPSEHVVDAVAPTGLRIDALDTGMAPVLPVGIDDRGELAVPGARDVGWYRYGPRPGEPGVTVLAAHIAFDGVDGVFRHLDDLTPGDEVVVALSDGTEQRYRVTGLTQNPKEALPPELWVREGDPRLALVTCGGTFDAARRSYTDNVIAWAEPA